MMNCSNISLFNAPDKYVKFQDGNLIANEGATTVDRQILKDLRMPYHQLLRGKIVLKAGQSNYLLNNLGLGDNATLLSIAAKYDHRSIIEPGNFVTYAYFDAITTTYTFAQMLLLTGNSTNRIPQLYLSNPNMTYSVSLDVLVANIDDIYEFFNNVQENGGTVFSNLYYTYINTSGFNLIINDAFGNPQIYIPLEYVHSLNRVGATVYIELDSTGGTVVLNFIDATNQPTEYNAKQAYSLLNYVWSNYFKNNVVPIGGTYSYVDNVAPVAYFYTNVGNTASGATLSMAGATTSGPYNTGIGTTFSATIPIATFGHSGVLQNTDLIGLLIYQVVDNYDGVISLNEGNVIVTGTSGVVTSFTASGSYSLTFNISDYAGNFISNTKNIMLNII